MRIFLVSLAAMALAILAAGPALAHTVSTDSADSDSAEAGVPSWVADVIANGGPPAWVEEMSSDSEDEDSGEADSSEHGGPSDNAATPSSGQPDWVQDVVENGGPPAWVDDVKTDGGPPAWVADHRATPSAKSGH